MVIKMGRKLVYGVGLNDSLSSVTWFGAGGKRETCKIYKLWTSMLGRCYSLKYQLTHQSYIGCSVCEEWLTFSNFKAWVEQQHWEGKELDKDLIKDGNRIYSPSLCIFIDKKVNKFIRDNYSGESITPVGICKVLCGLYQVDCHDSVTLGKSYVGLYKTEQEARIAFLERKLHLARILAGNIDDEIVSWLLISRYEKKLNDYLQERVKQ